MIGPYGKILDEMLSDISNANKSNDTSCAEGVIDNVIESTFVKTGYDLQLLLKELKCKYM